MNADTLARGIIDAIREIDDPMVLADRTPTGADYCRLWDSVRAVLEKSGINLDTAFPGKVELQRDADMETIGLWAFDLDRRMAHTLQA